MVPCHEAGTNPLDRGTQRINGHSGTVPISISVKSKIALLNDQLIVIGNRWLKSGDIVRGDVYFKKNFLENLEWFVG